MPSERQTAERQATYRSLFAVAEFRAMWTAQALSGAGNQVGRVAIAVLAYDRTRSPLLTGLAYALTYLPAIFGGPLLSVLADIFPRRAVMLCCDLVSAALVAAMAIPHVPYWVLCVLLVGTVLLSAPFSAARIALMPEILPGDALPLGQGAVNIAFQVNQVGGFAVGGALVAALGTGRTLVADAATFIVSACIVAARVQRRPAPARESGSSRSLLRGVREGWTLVFGNRIARSMTFFGWLAAFYVLPEGIAVPYAHALGGGPPAAGLLMAAMPVGTVLGATALARLCPPARQNSAMGWLATLSCAPLIVCACRPALPVVLLLWMISGVGSVYQMPAVARFIRAVPASGRASAFGIAQSGLLAAQGIGILAGGAAAQAFGPTATVAVSGLAGLAVAIVLAISVRGLRADPRAATAIPA
jgi:MFS family permease